MQNIICKGKPLSLSDNSFLSSGGEGDIYLQNGTVYKIFHKVISPDFANKLQDLTVLDRPDIIRPLDLVYSKTGDSVGYTMSFCDNTVGMPLLFTTSYITRNNISLSATQKLVQQLMATTEFIHSKKCIIADANENNFLIDKATYEKAYFIDVDSYQTPRYPATAIMLSIRDYTSNKFTELSDFYSLAILTFQLFVGIHPYKGKHPTLKTIEERCKHHVSVFNKDVNMPSAVRDFNTIPKNYLYWYQDIFEKGLRLPPPNMISAPQVRLQRKYVSASFIITKVFSADQAIKKVEWLVGNTVVMTEDNIYINGKQFKRHDKHSVVVVSVDGTLYEAFFTKDGLNLIYILQEVLSVNSTLRASKWFSIEGRLYSIYGSQLFEIELRTIGNNIIPLIIYTQAIHEQASRIFANVLYMNLFGKAYFYIPHTTKTIKIIAVTILDTMRIIDASYEKNYLIIIASTSTGEIKRYIIKIDTSQQGFIIEDTSDIDMQEINTTTLSNGVNIMYDSIEDQIDISLGTNHKVIQNAGIPNNARIASTGTFAHYFVDDSLYKFQVK